MAKARTLRRHGEMPHEAFAREMIRWILGPRRFEAWEEQQESRSPVMSLEASAKQPLILLKTHLKILKALADAAPRGVGTVELSTSREVNKGDRQIRDLLKDMQDSRLVCVDKKHWTITDAGRVAFREATE